MAISRKDSRPITVRGRSYRWMAKRVTRSERDAVRITVEDQGTGELVQSVRRGWEGDSPAVTPGVVKEIILARFPQP